MQTQLLPFLPSVPERQKDAKNIQGLGKYTGVLVASERVYMSNSSLTWHPRLRRAEDTEERGEISPGAATQEETSSAGKHSLLQCSTSDILSIKCHRSVDCIVGILSVCG